MVKRDVMDVDGMPARCLVYGHAWTEPDRDGWCCCVECGTPNRFKGQDDGAEVQDA